MKMPLGSVTIFDRLEIRDYFCFIHTDHTPINFVSIYYLDENEITYEIGTRVYKKEDLFSALNMEEIPLAFSVPVYPNMKVIKVLRDGSFVSK